jgi:hypothetical protein
MTPPSRTNKNGNISDSDGSTVEDDEEDPQVLEPEEPEPPESQVASNRNDTVNPTLASLNPGLSQNLWRRLQNETVANNDLRRRLNQEMDRVARVRSDKFTQVTQKNAQITDLRERVVKVRKDARSEENKMKKKHLDALQSKIAQADRLRADLSSTRMASCTNLRRKNLAENKLKQAEKTSSTLATKLREKEDANKSLAEQLAEKKKTLNKVKRENVSLEKTLKAEKDKKYNAQVHVWEMKLKEQELRIQSKEKDKENKEATISFEMQQKADLEKTKATLKHFTKASELHQKAHFSDRKVRLAVDRVIAGAVTNNQNPDNTNLNNAIQQQQQQQQAIQQQQQQEARINNSVSPNDPSVQVINRHFDPSQLFQNTNNNRQNHNNRDGTFPNVDVNMSQVSDTHSNCF